MKQKPDIIMEEIGDGYMLVPVSGDKLDSVVSINESGGFVWDMLKEDVSFSEIVEALMAEYGISKEVAEADLRAFLKTIEDYVVS